MLDGSFLTWWSSENIDATPSREILFTVDLGAVRSVSRICVFWGDDQGRNRAHPASFTVECGADASSLVAVHETDDEDVPVDSFASHRLGTTYTEVVVAHVPAFRYILLRLRRTVRKWCNHAIHGVQAWGTPSKAELAEMVRAGSGLAVHGDASALSIVSPSLARGGLRRLLAAAARTAGEEGDDEDGEEDARRSAVRPRNLLGCFETEAGSPGASRPSPASTFETIVMPALPEHLWREVFEYFGRSCHGRAAMLSRSFRQAVTGRWKTHPNRLLLDWARHGRCVVAASAVLGPGDDGTEGDGVFAPGAHSPENVLDGTHTTAWRSGPPFGVPVTLAVDLGAVVPVSAIQLHWGVESGTLEHPPDLRVLLSRYGDRFKTVFSLASVTRSHRSDGFLTSVNDIRLPAEEHIRYVQIEMVRTHPRHDEFALRTLNVWGLGDAREEQDIRDHLIINPRLPALEQHYVECDSTGMPGLVPIMHA